MTEELSVEEIEQLHRDYEQTYMTDSGRRVLAHMVMVGHVYSSIHAPGDSHTTAYNNGQREFVLMVLKMLQPLTEKDREGFEAQLEEDRKFEAKFGVPAPR